MAIELKNKNIELDLDLLSDVKFKKLTLKFNSNLIESRYICWFEKLQTESLVIHHRDTFDSGINALTYNMWDLMQLQEKLPTTEIEWRCTLADSDIKIELVFITSHRNFKDAVPYELSNGSTVFVHGSTVNIHDTSIGLSEGERENILASLNISPLRDPRDFRDVVTTSPSKSVIEKSNSIGFTNDLAPLLPGKQSKLPALFSFSYASDYNDFCANFNCPVISLIPYDQNPL